MEMSLRRLARGAALALFAGAVGLSGVQGAVADTIVVAAPHTPEGFDGDALRPGTQEAVVQIYEGLTRYGRVTRDGREYLDPSVIEGHLAESWTVSDDGRRYVFKLREGVLSARGNELTADDVVWGWNKSFAQRRTGNFIASVSNVESVEEVSRYEVAFNLNAPSSIFLKALTLYVPGIYDTDEVRKHATADDPWALKWMETNVAGFGAYHLEALRPGEQAVFVANPNYFRGQPDVTRVIYRAIPSAANRITLLRTGQVQWIDRPTVQQALELQQDLRVKVQDHFGRAIAGVRMNMQSEPFDDVRVRQAMNYAIDKDRIRQAVFLGTGEPALSLVPPIVDGYDPSFFAYQYDPQKARELLAAAGYADGLQTEILYSDIWWWQEPLAIQVASQLREIGVEAQPTRITASDLRSRGAPAVQDMPFFTFEDGPIVLDPVYTFYLIAHSRGVSNRSNYSNPQVDALIDEARQLLDAGRRNELMREAQRLWMEDAPWIVTFYPTLFEAMSPRVSGWVPHPDDHERWVDLRVE